MQIKEYDEIWSSIILPIYEEMNIDNQLYMKRNAYKRVYRKYESIRIQLKQRYMMQPEKYLDCHKIASCMIYALVKVYPIKVKKSGILKKFKEKQTFDDWYLFLNEYLSLYTAFSIIESFRQYECEQSPIHKGYLRNEISIPRTSNGEDYIRNTCLDLYFSKANNNINVLTLSNVLFLLENPELVTPDKVKKKVSLRS